MTGVVSNFRATDDAVTPASRKSASLAILARRLHQMTIVVGLIVTLICLFGGFMAMGGHVGVIWQPWEYVIICGSALGTFIVANPLATIKDSGKACLEAFKNASPKQRDYLDLLSALFLLMRALRTLPSSKVEEHVDDPDSSDIFTKYPALLANRTLINFICDYVRLIIIGNARTHEIEALMDEEIHTLQGDKLKPYTSMQTMSEGLPALGIVAAVLGVIKAMGAIDQSPEILGGLIGAALVGTFAGIFFSYAVVSPIATQIKIVRTKQLRLYFVTKQTLLAFMNGAVPQVAIEHGRKTISAYQRPTIEEMETEISAVPAAAGAEDMKTAA
jgi:chemotaxis protein MotA